MKDVTMKVKRPSLQQQIDELGSVTRKMIEALECRLRERDHVNEVAAGPRYRSSGAQPPFVVSATEISINNGGIQVNFGFATSRPEGVVEIDHGPRIQLVPQAAKALARELMAQVDRFEAVHGPICPPEESHRRWMATSK